MAVSRPPWPPRPPASLPERRRRPSPAPVAGATPTDPSFAAPTPGPATASSPAAGSAGTGGPVVAGGAAPAPATGNGGATFRGVTDKSIEITALSLNTNTVGTFCPRCGNGNAGLKGGAYAALMAAWKRDGKLPIYGRDLEVTVRAWDALSAEEARNACVQAARVDKPFMMIAGSGPVREPGVQVPVRVRPDRG